MWLHESLRDPDFSHSLPLHQHWCISFPRKWKQLESRYTPFSHLFGITQKAQRLAVPTKSRQSASVKRTRSFTATVSGVQCCILA